MNISEAFRPNIGIARFANSVATGRAAAPVLVDGPTLRICGNPLSPDIYRKPVTSAVSHVRAKYSV